MDLFLMWFNSLNIFFTLIICHGVSVEVGGQFAGVGALLLPGGPGD